MTIFYNNSFTKYPEKDGSVRIGEITINKILESNSICDYSIYPLDGSTGYQQCISLIKNSRVGRDLESN